MFFITLTDFALGLFVGVYALASFAPPHIARNVYKACWFFCAGFVVLAYLQTQMKTSVLPTAQNLKNHSKFTPDDIQFFGLAVIVGIIISLVGGWFVLNKKFPPIPQSVD